MLPAKIQTAVARRQSEKQYILETVYDQLNSDEKAILKAGTSKSIITNKQDDIGVINILVNGIARDIGIKGEIDKSDKIRFYDILGKYYTMLTLSDVKLAFEFAVVGRLNQYLPRDRNGEPDKNHYQSFSTEYVSKILNAYNRYLSETIINVRILLPEKIERVTDEMKEESHNQFLNTIYEQFEKYKETGIYYFPISFLVVEELIKAGFSDVEITDEIRHEAFFGIMYGRYYAIGEGRKKTIDEKVKGKESDELSNVILLLRYDKIIANAFAEMKKGKVNIKDVIK